MQKDIGKFVFRFIAIENLVYDLKHGLFSKRNAPETIGRSIIANREIIEKRDHCPVKIIPGTVVNDYVPFYFSFRTPMLFNIHTGMGVPQKKQEDIVYLCVPLQNLMNTKYQWCFTDGNAAISFTRFYNKVEDLVKIDWHSINSNDFRINNEDGDVDRIRKKQAEFLVKDFVPVDEIEEICVYNEKAREKAEGIIKIYNLEHKISVVIKKEYYF